MHSFRFNSGSLKTDVPLTMTLSTILLRLSVVGLVLLGAGELVSRAFLTAPSAQDYDAELGWVWRPGALVFNANEGGAPITVNERGLIDDALTAKAGRRRALVLGNSFTEAIQLPVAENFTSRLERQLTGWDIVNAGRSAMGPAHYPVVAERLRDLEPDLLVVVVGQGDLTHLLGPETVAERSPDGRVLRVRPAVAAKDELKRYFEPLLSRSALASYLMRRLKPVVLDWLDALRGGDESEVAQDAGVGQEGEAVARLAAVLVELRTRAPVLLVDVPHIAYEASRRGRRAAPTETRVYSEAAALAGVPFLDVGDPLLAAYAATGIPGHGFANNAVGSGHLSPEGHAAVGTALAESQVWLGPTNPGGPPTPPVPRPPTAPQLNVPGLTAVWANDGGDKVPRGELRSQPRKNSVFDGGRVRLFAARNETVSFQVILEAAGPAARGLSVVFDRLEGPTPIISRRAAVGAELFDWVGRPIEVFFVKYLPIKGLSLLTWSDYDERHLPEKFRRPHDAQGRSKARWEDRPHADAWYPDIAVPIERIPTFEVPSGANQAIWVDVVVPKTAAPGAYRGSFSVVGPAGERFDLPVELTVRGFELPDRPTARTMLQLGYGDINHRYLGKRYPDVGDPALALQRVIQDRHFLLAHRHRISLIDSNYGPEPWDKDEPRPAWRPRLDGSLFVGANGYDGPGVGMGNGVFSIGTYGQWGWKDRDAGAMHQHLDRWASWLSLNAPGTDAFLYLIDESEDYELIERWASWVRSNPGPGHRIKSFATVAAPWAVKHTPSLDIVCSALKVGQAGRWQRAADALISDPRRELCMYNGGRPGSGTLAIEDDGVALRNLGWVQWKHKVDRWFVWESTYYNNFQGGQGETRLFSSAHTFGGRSEARSPSAGETGWNYTNGDGVLFYPGTDQVHPAESLEIPGPIASLRLKHWRRGIQDHAYLTLAAAVAPDAVAAIVSRLLPKTLWENDVDNPVDPTYVHCPTGWSTRADDYEAARAELADIIERGVTSKGAK